MAKRGKRAAKTNAPPTKREVDDFFRTLRKYGLEELYRWRDRYQKLKRKRGRRRFVFDKEFLAFFGEDWFASLPHRKRVEFIEQMYQSDKKQSEVKTLLPAAREAWDPRRHMGGGSVESIVRRLERQLPKRPKATRKTVRV